MNAKEYLKGVARATIGPVVKALSSAFPSLGPGFSIVAGRAFGWSLNGMQAYNNKIFYAASNLLVTKLTEVPILFNKKKDTPKAKSIKFNQFYSKNITNEARVFIKNQALTELENHPLNDLFDNPNTYQSGLELLEDFWHNYDFGDGYLFFETIDVGRNAGKPVRVHSLHRNRVEPVKSNDRFDAISLFRYTAINGTQIDIDKKYILHLKRWNPVLEDLRGLGVDQITAMDISLNNSNSIAQGAAFENGGRGTLFSSDVAITSEGKPVGKLTAEQIKTLKETVMSDFAGAKNNRRMHFTNGKVDVQAYGDTLAEMELIGASTANWEHIYATMGIPDVLCPTTKASTESNVKAGYKALVTNNIISKLRKFDMKLNQKIQQWYPDVISCHDLTEFSELAPDLELMMKVYGKPTLSEDERRAVFGYDEMEGGMGKVYLVPSGLMKIEDLVSNDFNSLPDPNSPESKQYL